MSLAEKVRKILGSEPSKGKMRSLLVRNRKVPKHLLTVAIIGGHVTAKLPHIVRFMTKQIPLGQRH